MSKQVTTQKHVQQYRANIFGIPVDIQKEATVEIKRNMLWLAKRIEFYREDLSDTIHDICSNELISPEEQIEFISDVENFGESHCMAENETKIAALVIMFLKGIPLSVDQRNNIIQGVPTRNNSLKRSPMYAFIPKTDSALILEVFPARREVHLSDLKWNHKSNVKIFTKKELIDKFL